MFFKESVLAFFIPCLSYIVNFSVMPTMHWLMVCFHLLVFTPGVIVYCNSDLYMFSILNFSVWYIYGTFFSMPYIICTFCLWYIASTSIVVRNSRIYMSHAAGTPKYMKAHNIIKKSFIFYLACHLVQDMDDVETFITFMFSPDTVTRFKNKEITQSNSFFYQDFRVDCDELWKKMVLIISCFFPLSFIVVVVFSYALMLYLEKSFWWFTITIFYCMVGIWYICMICKKMIDALTTVCVFLLFHLFLSHFIITCVHVLFGIYSCVFPEESLVFYYGVVLCVLYVNVIYFVRRRRSIISTLCVLFTSTQLLNVANYSNGIEFSKTKLFNRTSVVYLYNQTIVFDPHYNVSVSRKTINNVEVITTNRPEIFLKMVKQDRKSDIATVDIDGFQMPWAMYWNFRDLDKWNMSQIHRNLVRDGMKINETKWESNHIYPQEAQQDMIDFSLLLSAIDWKKINESCVDYAVDNYIPFIEKSMEMSMKSTVGELTVPFDVTPKELIRVFLKKMLGLMHAIFDNGEYETIGS